MPPARTKKAAAAAAAAEQPAPITGPLTVGAGITAGLELWKAGTQFVLVDRSADGRFADDITVWNSAVGLNDATRSILKDAAK
jgi:hypothetical protein